MAVASLVFPLGYRPVPGHRVQILGGRRCGHGSLWCGLAVQVLALGYGPAGGFGSQLLSAPALPRDDLSGKRSTVVRVT